MAKNKAVNPATLDWSKFPSSMPREGVVYPKGKRKTALVERIRHAWRNIKTKQVA
jgi:hypothetical protein